MPNVEKYTSQWDVYIGNDSDWKKNTKCTLEPRLAADYKDRVNNWGDSSGEKVSDYGFVEWCNMSGKYVTFVARGVPSRKTSICNVGIFGNRYIREISPETIVEILAGVTHTLQVQHIRPEFA